MRIYFFMLIWFFFCTGNYFGCHFIMGGEKFDTPQPEAYLFGENADLNFLGSRPAPVSIMNYIIFYMQIQRVV